jgi:hypothetical protein
MEGGMKLSKAQVKALAAVKRRQCLLVYNAGDGWTCPQYGMRTVSSLKKRGLVQTYPVVGSMTIEVGLTIAGYQALEDINAD